MGQQSRQNKQQTKGTNSARSIDVKCITGTQQQKPEFPMITPPGMHFSDHNHHCYNNRGDGLAQWLECWTGDPKVEGLNPVRSTKKYFIRVKKVVLTRCRCARPPCVYARIQKTMYAH